LRFVDDLQARTVPPPSHIGFRLAALAFAMLLMAECVWLELVEFPRPRPDRLPTNPQAAAAAAGLRDDAARAASIGTIRGDLWAQAGFTFADLIWLDPGATPDPPSLDEAREMLDRAVFYAPHQSAAWLLAAALSARFHQAAPDPAEALKMSYYTGSGELQLMPLRLLVAARADLLSNAEVQEFAGRDVRQLFAHQLARAVTQAYAAASAGGRRFIEQQVRDIDPSFLQSLGASAAPR
jgi:hypothetical protein